MAQLIESFLANDKPAPSSKKDLFKKEEEKSIISSSSVPSKFDKIEPVIQ